MRLAMNAPTPLTPSLIVRHFAPGWPAAVMGTGGFALATLRFAGDVPALEPLAWALHWLNLALFALIAVPWIARWLFARDAAVATLRHPVAASFYPTFPIALLVLAAQLRAFGNHQDAALAAWWLSTAGLVVMTLAVLKATFEGDHVRIEHVHPGMFIPPVGMTLIPVAGVPLLAVQEGLARELALVVNIVGLGAGLVMYLAVLSLTLHRLYVHARLPAPLAPTLWVHLAPVGVIIVGTLVLAPALPGTFVTETTQGPYLFAAFLLWGFGTFWMLLALLMTASAMRAGQLPFSLAWWAFTFPLGAFALGCQRLSDLTGVTGVLLVGWFAWLLLAGFWTAALARSVRGVLNGELLR